MYLINSTLSFLHRLSAPFHLSHSSFSLQVPFLHSCLFVLAPEFNQGSPCNHGSKTIHGSWRAHRWMYHWWWVCGLESHYQYSIVPPGKRNSAAPSPFTMSCCPVLCKPSEDNQSGYDFTVVMAMGCSKDSAAQLVSLSSGSNVLPALSSAMSLVS